MSEELEQVHKTCTILVEIFTELISKNNGIDSEKYDRLLKATQLLAAILKKKPEYIEDADVADTISIFASTSEEEYPKLHETFTKVVSLSLKFLPTTSLEVLWVNTISIELCHAIVSIGSIDPKPFFRKLLYFVERPQNEIAWLRKFVALLKTPSVETIESDLVLQITGYITDSCPLRSALAFMILSTFLTVNTMNATYIVSSWLITPNKTLQNAYQCRTILAKATKSCLNLVATLAFEFPIVLCILPTSVEGYNTLATLTLHRMHTFHPEKFGEFIDLCDPYVRQLNKNEVNSNPAIQLLDAAKYNVTSKRKMAKIFAANEPNQDFAFSSLAFGRTTTMKNSAFLSTEQRDSIKRMLMNQSPSKERMIDEPHLNANELNICSELIEHSKIAELSKFVSNIIF